MPFVGVISFDFEFPPKKMQFRFTYYIYVCVCACVRAYIKYLKNLTGRAAILIARCLNATEFSAAQAS